MHMILHLLRGVGIVEEDVVLVVPETRVAVNRKMCHQ